MTLSHGPIDALSQDLFCVRGEIKLKGLGRRMVVARDASRRLFVHNAIFLDDFGPLDALGEVRAIFVPNRYHDMDGGRMKERYPQATLCALPAVRARLSKKFPALAPFDPALLPASATITALPGLKGDEPVMEVLGPEGATQVYTDALFNLPHGSGLMLRLMGSSGGLKMTPIGRLALLADRAAFRAYLEAQAARSDVVRVIVSHGDVLEGNAAVREAFAAAARRLA